MGRCLSSCWVGNITFRYLDSQTKTNQTRTLPTVKFLWLILQHVQPKGLNVYVIAVYLAVTQNINFNKYN
ncbi:MAG: transposase [Photobacterium frigidiphilum]